MSAFWFGTVFRRQSYTLHSRDRTTNGLWLMVDTSPTLADSPNARLETFTNDLAVYSYSCIVSAVADVLQQVRHLGKRAPLATFGRVFLPFPGLCLSLSILY